MAVFRRRSRLLPPRLFGQIVEAYEELFANSTRIERSVSQHLRPAVVGPHAEIMTLLCDDNDLPNIKLHGLRMLAPAIIEDIPLSSADSAMVARNVNRDAKWSGACAPRTKAARAITLRDRIEDAPCATAWKQLRDEQAPQMDLELEVVGNY